MCDAPGCACERDDRCASCRRAKMRARQVSKALAQTATELAEIVKASRKDDKHYSVPAYTAGGAVVGAVGLGGAASLMDEARRDERAQRQAARRAPGPLRARGRGVTTMDPAGLRPGWSMPSRSDGAFSQDRRLTLSPTNLVGDVASSRSRRAFRAPRAVRSTAGFLSRNRYAAAGAAVGGAYTGGVYGLTTHLANRQNKQRRERAALSKG